jgi:TPR repeat protein
VLILFASAAYVAHSIALRAAGAIDFECSWGMQLQQALALVGPCNSSIAVGMSYYGGGLGAISGSATSVNYTKAAQWFARALRRGCTHALRPLALSLYSATTLSASTSFLLERKQGTGGYVCDTMTKCADAGHVDCIALLADLLYKGMGGCPQDFAAGGQRAVAAGHGGSVHGACLLASMITDGRAFTRRAEEALKWARVCNMHGGGDSAAAVEQLLLQEVSPEDDEAARTFALQWRNQRQIDLAI